MRKQVKNILKLQMLQEIFNKNLNMTLKLPQIAVIGSQSSGKSSVLDQIIQKDFLPRGTGFITKCPIIINMRYCNSNVEYAEFSHILDKKFTDFILVKNEILNRMMVLTKKAFIVSKEPIIINYYSKNTFDLTLVDLPGLIKVPLDGQPSDIEKQVKEIIFEYTKDESSLLLCIICANMDLANSESLNICKKIDPEGKRTLGVLTKIDLMDLETDCTAILKNKNNTLLHGYIGVINRGQSDLNSSLTLVEAKKKENDFFKNHTKYKCFYPKIGSKFLIAKLNEIFHTLLVDKIPKLRKIIEDKIKDLERELDELGENVDINNDMVFTSVLQYCKIVEASLKNEEYISDKKFMFFSKNEDVFVVLIKSIFEKIKKMEFVFSGNLKEIIDNSNTFFIDESVFKHILKNRFKEFNDEIKKSCSVIFNIAISKINSVENYRFVNLAIEFNKITSDFLNLQYLRLMETIQNYSEIQMSYFNYNHPDFSKVAIFSNVIQKIVRKKKNTALSLKFDPWNSLFGSKNAENISNENIYCDESFEYELVSKATDSYFTIIKKSMIDFSIKSCYFYFVESVITKLYAEICKKIDLLEKNIFIESIDVINRRKQIKNELTHLKKAYLVFDKDLKSENESFCSD
ncbi:dynamin [Hamiltosporidium tvaerminnensis]|uniref:Dynamin n=1 Tax=Hamiltosporidium tvaerminnensis TaxID=1176355 RepID=A0A4Q9M0Q4_9MICR|nr:dynamin [Hamiltosporidium tvaerminnensis]